MQRPAVRNGRNNLAQEEEAAGCHDGADQGAALGDHQEYGNEQTDVRRHSLQEARRYLYERPVAFGHFTRKGLDRAEAGAQ